MLLALAVVVGPAPALAQAPDAALYEVTEDMYLKDAAGKFVTSPAPGGRRIAVARLSGWAKVGTRSARRGCSLSIPRPRGAR